MAFQLRRAHTVCLSLATAAVAAFAFVPAVSASASGASVPNATQPDAGSGDRQADTNKALVINFNDQLFNNGDLSLIDKYVSPNYIQHNPTLPSGPAALRQLVTTVRSLFPHLKTTTVRAVAEGDLVVLENRVVPVPGGPANANFDIYRVEGGKLVEHWDVLQAEPGATVSGNDMLSLLSSPASDDAPATTATRDKAVVLNFLTALTQDHELGAVDQYVSPSLYQHDPTVADGSAALTHAYASLFAQYPAYSISIAQVAAEGDLVAVHAHVRNTPSDLGEAVVYLYRVRHGKIVEQWDSVQAVPATSANDNTMF
jgi:predicted SnoaL-like aldol condensation-catalyzing enzyme